MAEAFIPNIYNKPFVNHIDGNKQNNNLDNLEWVTESENSIHAYKKGLIKILKGVDKKKSNLTEKQVIEIYYAGGLYENIGNHFNVSKSTIFDIKHKKTWKHILKDDYIKNIKYQILKEENLINNKIKHQIDNKTNIKNKHITNNEKYTIDVNGNVYNTHTNKYLKNSIRNGYCFVTLNGKHLSIHKLVADTFIPNIDNKPIINHIDGNKQNNSVDNLEWCTYKENASHSYKSGLTNIKKGVDNVMSKLTNIEVIDIFLSTETSEYLSIKYSVHKNHITRIKRKERWKHLTDFL